MKVIKDTMPTSYEVKDGFLGYNFGNEYGTLIKKNNKLRLPILPMFVFLVDKKPVGIFQCENVVEIEVKNKEQVFKEIYNHTIATLMEFHRFARTQFAIDNRVKFEKPSYETIKNTFEEKISRFLFS